MPDAGSTSLATSSRAGSSSCTSVTGSGSDTGGAAARCGTRPPRRPRSPVAVVAPASSADREAPADASRKGARSALGRRMPLAPNRWRKSPSQISVVTTHTRKVVKTIHVPVESDSISAVAISVTTSTSSPDMASIAPQDRQNRCQAIWLTSSRPDRTLSSEDERRSRRVAPHSRKDQPASVRVAPTPRPKMM